MIAGQKSTRNGIQDILCPFTDIYITQGSGGEYSHKGTKSIDVRGKSSGVKYAYYAPCDVICVSIYAPNGESRWQSTSPVRFATGVIDYLTFEIAHDNSFNAYIGQKVSQGAQLGKLGNAGNCTGVHCHIQMAQTNDKTFFKNSFGVYMLNNEREFEECCFMDNTNIISGSANWKYLNDVPVGEVSPETIYTHSIGDKVVVNGTLFTSAEGDISNGTISSHITNITSLTEGTKHPYSFTGDIGWIGVDDVKAYEDETPVVIAGLSIGDSVSIVGVGNGNSSGTGATAYGIGWTRSILDRDLTKAYPYRVGNSSGTTGYYKESSLQKK